MSGGATCKDCGRSIPPDSPGGFCGQCLLALGLEPARAGPETAAGDPGPDDRSMAATRIAPTERPGDRIGRYRLLQEIGQGSCGVVYMAEQEEPVRRRVALKVIKVGMDTRQVVARFDAERQALALMDHPNIARVFDAGAADSGRPYFVMELVRGVRITDYCDQNALPVRERLKLFTQVCRAVQHAHQKGIIHRDLKPSNVLVTLHDGVPVPKVIDFGIAKATQGHLTDQTLFTAYEQFLGTPAYMSPEQAELSGLDIDTRSDLYSLGVLLYELLTGTTSFDTHELLKAGLDELRRTIREREPVRPSTRLMQRLAVSQTPVASRKPPIDRDLDWIVMKCLEKDRSRRYETATGLALDIERHLGSEPVVARPPSAAYRLQRLVRRHRLAFTATIAVTLVLVLGIAVSTWLAVRATRARGREVEQRRTAEAARREESRQRLLAEEAGRRLRQSLYVSDMGVAWRSWAEGDAARTRQLLDKYRAAATPADDPRGFEWRYLRQLSRPDESLILPHGSSCARHSPDGRLLAIADPYAADVWLWDVAARRMLRSFRPFERSIWSVAFSPDGRVLATASRNDPDFKFWDVESGDLIATLPGRSQANFGVIFSPDGRRVATVAGTAYQPLPAEVKVWDFADRKELMSLPGLTTFVVTADFSPDGETLAVGDGDGVVRLWDLATGAVRSLTAHRGFIMPVRFSPVGALLASADEHGAILLWDWRAGRLLRVLTGHQGPVNSLAVSPDGKRLASGGWDHTARLWDMSTGEQLARWLGHAGRVWSVDFSPDGRTLVTGSSGETVRFWPVGPKPEHEILTRTAGGNGIGFSPDGRFLFVDEWETNPVVASSRVTLWDPDSRTVAHRLPGRDIAFSPDGKILTLIRDETNVVVFEAATLLPRGTIPVPGRLTGAKAISPDGRLLALRSDGRPVILDLEARRQIATLEAGSSGGAPLLFSRDGRTLIAADSPDGAIRLWDTSTWQTRGWLRGHQAAVGALALSPDGAMFASAGGTTMLLWDLAAGALAENPSLHGNSGAIETLAFSPDGRTLAAGSFDGPISLWSVPGRQEIGSLKAHVTAVWGVEFSPDGRTLASTSYDFTVRLWRAPGFSETDVGR